MSGEGRVICKIAFLRPHENRRQPPLASPRFKLVSYQNAAGLWLKYGAKYGKSFLNAGP
jgi:hypothetical protein